MGLKVIVAPLYFFPNYFISLLLITVLILGDKLEEINRVGLQYKAFIDNITHCIIGGLCYLQYALICKSGIAVPFLDIKKILFEKHVLVESALCALVSSVIDLDHFFAARSLRITAATSLSQRPPLHCTTNPLALFFLLLVLYYGTKNPVFKKMAFIVFIAFFSHHTRDATRRGYWFCPFGSTRPIPYGLYLFLTVLVPYTAFTIDKTCCRTDVSYGVLKQSVIDV